MASENKAIVDEVNAAFEAGDMAKFLSFCADDLEWTMVGEGTHRGKDAIREWMTSMPSENPAITVVNTIADGDHVASHGHMTMKNRDGVPVSYSYCDVYRFSGGLIAELNAFVMRRAP